MSNQVPSGWGQPRNWRPPPPPPSPPPPPGAWGPQAARSSSQPPKKKGMPAWGIVLLVLGGLFWILILIGVIVGPEDKEQKAGSAATSTSLAPPTASENTVITAVPGSPAPVPTTTAPPAPTTAPPTASSAPHLPDRPQYRRRRHHRQPHTPTAAQPRLLARLRSTADSPATAARWTETTTGSPANDESTLLAWSASPSTLSATRRRPRC